MKTAYLTTAAALLAAVMLAGCGNVDAPLEKKNVVSNTTTKFTFPSKTTSASEELTLPTAPEESDANAVTTAIPATTTKKLTTTVPLPATQMPAANTTTTTTTPAPTTTTTTTTTTPAPETTTTTTTTTPPPTTTTPAPPPTETTTTTTTRGFADPLKPAQTAPNLSMTAKVLYNNIEFGIGDSMSNIEEELGDQISAPTAVKSLLSRRDVLVYHFCQMDVEVDDDIITGISIEDNFYYGPAFPELSTGVMVGSSIYTVLDEYGDGEAVDERTIMYSDGAIRMLVYVPESVVEKISITVV